MGDTVTERATGTYPLGVGRPPLGVGDLPTPEEVFGVSRIGPKEALRHAVGPSLIALGVAIGSGEWLLGPQAVGESGFIGIGWIILVSALLQVIYNVECSRYVIATGEVPVVGFGRVPPGSWFWVPFSLLAVFFAFIWGGWVKSAASGLFALINGEVAGPGDKGTVEVLAVVLLLAVLGIALSVRKITRGLELINAGMVASVVLFLIVVDLLIVPAEVWWEGIRSLVTPAKPPAGTTATTLGGLAGFTALASGLNWFFMSHYRDKAYGMGNKVGFLAGMRAARTELKAVGVTFPDDSRNASVWRRWTRFLYLDMWGIFFTGAIVGMILPTILMRHLVVLSGESPTTETIPTFTAVILGDQYGRGMFYLALLVGFLILFSTQLGIFEGLVRVATDAANSSPRMQQTIGRDPRRFYFPFMFALTVVIAIVLHFFQPAELIQISANMSNFGALVFPFVFIYLNRRLPRVARPRRWTYVALMANVLFFGFFFLNFVVEKLTDSPLVKF